jgi:PIN domain nuclease of toxin-antitoxin system
VRLLLDTHTFLWFIMGDQRLSATARALIENVANERLLSVGSLWEIAIKVSLGKLVLNQPFETLFPAQLEDNAIGLLGITVEHSRVVAGLPFHQHRDPFDRLLVAQSQVEQAILVSADESFDAYAVQRTW